MLGVMVLVVVIVISGGKGCDGVGGEWRCLVVNVVVVGGGREQKLSVFLLGKRNAFLLRSRSTLLLCSRSALLLRCRSALLLYTRWVLSI